VIAIAAVKNIITLFVKKERDEKCEKRKEKVTPLSFGFVVDIENNNTNWHFVITDFGFTAIC
jgi:hypothetical protein